ncbi:MAG: MotA/TolQ/ExbB proton channel family protein [Nannocystaceae bacterium]
MLTLQLVSSPGLLGAVDIGALLFSSQGIVLVVVLLLLSLVALSLFVIFYKMIHVSQAQSQSIAFLDRFWESKRLDEIYQSAQKLNYSPIAAMFAAGYVELSKVKKKADQPSAGTMHEKMDGLENVERALSRARVSEMTKLENLLPFLATVGATAPFIGLFGTVWGIMEAFLNIAAAGQADLATVSQPIAEALVTTALALASAIPSVVAFNYFNRRLKVLGAEMSTFGSDYINIVKRHFF